MRRGLATIGTTLLLTWPLAACGNDASQGSDGSLQAGAAGQEPAAPSDNPVLDALPAAAPELPKAMPLALPQSAAAFDACTVVTRDLVTEVFGAGPGQVLPQESGLGDPQAGDCYYYGGESLIAVEATTRADQDLPEDSYSYDGIPGAVTVPGADRGWAVIFPGQEGAGSTVSGLIIVKGQRGLNLAVSIAGPPYDIDTVLEFADRLLDRM